MNFLKIKKGDFCHYTFTLKYDQPKEKPKDNYGNIRFNYGVYHVDAQQDIILDASETMHRELSKFKKGDTIELFYSPIDGGKTKLTVNKIAPQAYPSPNQGQPNKPADPDLPPEPPEMQKPTPTKDEKIEGMYKDKQESIHVQSAIKMALETLSEKDKERTWTEIKVLLDERIRWFLRKIEGGLRTEIIQENMSPEDQLEQSFSDQPNGVIE